MESLSAYVSNIIYFVIFTAFVGIIVPHPKYKKYIDLVLGLVLIIIVVEPVGELLGVQAPPINQIFAGVGPADDEDMTELGRYEDMQLEMVRKTYNQYAEKQIRALLSYETRFDIRSAEIMTSDDLGEIIEINILLLEKKSGEKEYRQTLIRVEPVRRISPEAGPDESYAVEIKKMKKIISDFYNLSADNIHISMG